MKNLLFLLLAFTCVETFSQSTGNILPKQSKPETSKENIYVYTPPKGLFIPDSSNAFIIYNKGSNTKTKKALLIKTADDYEFAFTAPDSAKSFITGIVNKKGDPIDTRNDKGYIIYLYGNNGLKYEGAKIDAAQLLNFYGNYYLKLNVPADSLAAMYEADYKQFPKEKDKTYPAYLRVLYREKRNDVKPQMLQYAKQQQAINKEENWNNALTVYQVLKMDDEINSLTKKIVSKYPTGITAKYAAFNSIYQAATSTDKIALINDYKAKFGDADNNNLYRIIASAYEKEKNWNQYLTYTDSITDKNLLASVYNNTAWNLSGQNIDSAGENLEFAKMISKKSVDIIAEEMNAPEKYKPADDDDINDFKTILKQNYDGYIDTYALLLYKLNQADSAYYYENIVIHKPVGADAFERCAVYAEKAKGAEFAKQFIEEQLLKGYSTAPMKAQLKKIYAQLNLSDADYNNIMEKAMAAHLEKLKEEIKGNMKSGSAQNFTLKNLQGQPVSLASLKGKTVVVDFWATWCGPCKASFPGMQKAVNKFKDDKDVVFLFVDTWEDKDVKEMQSGAQNFITQHKYAFNVVLDDKDKTVADYNVRGIPTKFIINKNGQLEFSSVGFSGDTDALAEEISLMIDMAKNNKM